MHHKEEPLPPMHVVIVSKALVVGTYQRKVEAIAAHEDIQVTLLVPPYWRDSRGTHALEPLHTRGYTLKVIPIRFPGAFHWHYYPTLGRELAALRPDVLHMDEEPYNLATWLAIRYAVRLNIPSLFFTWQNLYRRYPPPFCLFERYVYRHVQFAIAGNQEALAVLRHKGYRGPVRVVPQFGVDPERFRPRPDGGGVPRPFTIGYVGGLVPEKGVDLLLRAVARLSGDWELHLVGSGPAEGTLRRLAHQLGIAQRVRWTPRQHSARMAEIYPTFDVLVLPSRAQRNWKEQFGRVLIEAMACEVPVIGSTCGEIPNVIGDAGLIFPEGDMDTLTAHLRHLQTHPGLRQELGRRGRARVLAHFTHERIAEETVAIYRKMLCHAQTS